MGELKYICTIIELSTGWRRADWLDNVGSLTSPNPIGLQGLYFFTFYWMEASGQLHAVEKVLATH
jgi:hypothetical protein